MSTQHISALHRKTLNAPLPLTSAPRPVKVSAQPETWAVVELLRFSRRHPGKLAAGTLAGLLLSLAYSLYQVPAYEATATLEIQEMNENFLNTKDLSPVSASSPTTVVNDMQTQLRVLRSDTLIERALGKVKPEAASGGAPLRNLVARLRGAAPAAPLSPESRIELTRNKLSVKETRQARIVDISYDSPDPRYAAALANAVAAEYIEQHIEWRTKMSQRTSEWLTAQLEDVRRKLTASEDNLQDYARRSGLLLTSGTQSLSEERLRQVQGGLLTAQQDRMTKQSRLETALAAPAGSSIEGVAETSLNDLQSKLTDLRRQRADLATVYKPNFDGVKRLDAQIATLDAAVRNERAQILQRLRNDYSNAVRRERMLETTYTQQTGLVSRETEKAVQYGMLKHEVDSNRQLYETMLQRVKEANIAAAMRASNVRVVDPAKTPRKPYRPTTALNLLWGLTAGLMFGAMFAVVAERVDARVQRPGDLGAYLDVPELGAVPSVDGARAAKLGYAPISVRDSVVDILPDGAAPFELNAKNQLELVTWQQRSSVIAESFRSILTSILFSNQRGDAPQMIVVTSVLAGEGKTTVASNLALALARMNRRVLLIDGDLRRSRLHEVFQVSNDYGLSDLLTLDAKGHRDILHYVTQKTAFPGVYLLASGPNVSSATDLLHSAIFADVLLRSREHFDLIVIDTPPMATVQDARILGRMADGVVLVVRAGMATRDLAMNAAQRLTEDGTALLGTVLNSWTSQ